ncbi:MFS transporter [Flammeovirga yaeyamensis]|uniref:Lysosomal dipeptide transporter MFSD1 n=1 Tax=Flammeovirga yaeyamensis TaxID=367791 RepID=A0AAX1N4H2_9BACT|nr:MFS transporter [Flammeovirga yaeyamensis]MBB3701459.1 MFS family permease [Flammeovirga yaeyamensis]NMF38509.1 MFS transporter [Flammeovirga yaeyamensis]QWG02410.1 MFS transporter [Flammeovirga yaeyamensis]
MTTIAVNQEKTSSLRAYLAVFSAGAFFFYSFIQMTLFSTEAMKEYFIDRLALTSASEFGSFAGTFLNGTVLLLIPIGVLLDKFSVKKVVLAMATIAVLCVFGTTFSSNVTVSSGFRFVLGITHCAAFMAPFRLAPRWFPSSKLALISGLLVTFAVFGGWVSGTPLLLLLEHFGGQTTMLINAFLGLAILICIGVFVKDSPQKEEEASTSSEGLSLVEGLKKAGSNPQNWLAGLFIGLLNLAVLLLGAIWGTTYLKFVNPDFSEATYTGIIGMIFIGTMVGSPICGWVSDKIQSRKKAMLGGAILSLIVMLLIMYPLSTGSTYFFIVFLALGFITSAQTVGYPVIGESNDDDVLGTANGLSAVVLMGMGAVGQPLFGWLVTYFGGGENATPELLQSAFQAAIWIMPIAFIGAGICGLFIKETFKK